MAKENDARQSPMIKLEQVLNPGGDDPMVTGTAFIRPSTVQSIESFARGGTVITNIHRNGKPGLYVLNSPTVVHELLFPVATDSDPKGGDAACTNPF